MGNVEREHEHAGNCFWFGGGGNLGWFYSVSVAGTTTGWRHAVCVGDQIYQ